MPFKNILQRRVSGPGAYGNYWRRYVPTANYAFYLQLNIILINLSQNLIGGGFSEAWNMWNVMMVDAFRLLLLYYLECVVLRCDCENAENCSFASHKKNSIRLFFLFAFVFWKSFCVYCFVPLCVRFFRHIVDWCDDTKMWNTISLFTSIWIFNVIQKAFFRIYLIRNFLSSFAFCVCAFAVFDLCVMAL